MKIKKIFLFDFISILFFSLLVLGIPWASYNEGYDNLDTFRYIESLENGDLYFQLKWNYNSLSDYIFNEWLWLKIQEILSIFFSPNFIFLWLIPFFNFYFLSLFVFKYASYRYICYFFTPIFLLFFTNQVRLALAASIFFLLWFVFRSSNKVFKVIASIILSSIHASMLMFIITVYLLYLIFSIKIKEYFKIFLSLIFALIFVVMNSSFLSNFLSYFGSDRGDYYKNFNNNFSLLTTIYFLFILFLLIAILLKKRIHLSLYQIIAIFVFAVVVFSYFFEGTYPGRYLSFFFPFIIISIYQTKNILYTLFFSIWVVYSIFMDFNILSFI